MIIFEDGTVIPTHDPYDPRLVEYTFDFSKLSDIVFDEYLFSELVFLKE